jgi:MoxR-like ATPase
MILTVYSRIPTFARGKVRAFVKSRPEFNGWLSNNNIESRQVSNRQLLEFAISHGYAAQVEALIDAAPAVTMGLADSISQTMSADEAEAMADLKANEDETAGLADPAALETEIAALVPAAPAAPAAHGMIEADSVLAPVYQFLSPFVLTELTKALAPVIALANKPAEVIVQQAMPTAPAGALPYAVPGKKAALGSIFGFKGNHASAMVTLWESHGAAPAIDPYYVVDALNMALMATALERGTNVWLGGPGGSGKSTLPEQFCAHTGRPFAKITFTRQTNVEDLVGGQSLKAGNTQWEDGVLIQAMRRPGTIILLDELTLAPAGVQGIIQGVADDHRTLTLPTGEKVRCAPGVAFVVADNTFGFGDETGIYAGTNQANGALVNRFKRMLKIDYLSPAMEAQALANHTGADLKACRHVADFMARARRMPEMENIILSLRQMTGFVQGVQDGFDVKTVAQVTILNRLPAAERAALETLFTLEWSNEFASLIGGKPMPKAPSSSAASNAFDDEVSASLSR